MMGPGGMGMMMGAAGQGTGLNLSADDVRQNMAAYMSGMGGGGMLGAVSELDDDLIDVEINDGTADVVHRVIVNRHTGAMMWVR
jgi:hypothetical protein